MSWSPELVFAAAIAAVVFLIGFLRLRKGGPRTRNVVHGKGRRGEPAPANLRYTCAGCSGQFTHSRRTLAARDKGAKSFYCNACHTRALTVPKPKPWQLVPGADRKPGCLGVTLLMLAVPLACAWSAWHWIA